VVVGRRFLEDRAAPAQDRHGQSRCPDGSSPSAACCMSGGESKVFRRGSSQENLWMPDAALQGRAEDRSLARRAIAG
jgi:hypothetical protein